MKTPQTKSQVRREQQYRAQLRACGFRSWKQANQQRLILIDLKIETGEEPADLPKLQRLCDLYLKRKTNDAAGRRLRCIKRLELRIFGRKD